MSTSLKKETTWRKTKILQVEEKKEMPKWFIAMVSKVAEKEIEMRKGRITFAKEGSKAIDSI